MTLRPWHLIYIAILTLLACLVFVMWVSADDLDVKIGVSTFRIWRQGGEVRAVPMIAPGFRLTLLKGDGNEPSTITKCGIFKRTMDMDREKGRVMVVTVLRCGENEYGVSEVVFDIDKH